PSASGQYSVHEPSVSLSATKNTAPRSGPKKDAGPPRSVISTGSADITQFAKSGTTVPWNGANNAPASPEEAPAMVDAARPYRRVGIPREAVRDGFSRIAARTRPSGERETRHSVHSAAVTTERVKR